MSLQFTNVTDGRTDDILCCTYWRIQRIRGFYDILVGNNG